MTPKATLSEIEKLTVAMVALGLSNEQNFPTTQGDPERSFEISVGSAAAMTVALKNLAYGYIYEELNKARAYNFKLLDGALVTLRYRFQAGEISEHSLTFFPSPDLEVFQTEPEVYLQDEIYAEVVARNVVPFPLRFDFCSDQGKFVEMHHPYSHLTLGQYENCRIPVCSPVGPLTFGTFLLRNFYNTAFTKYSTKCPRERSILEIPSLPRSAQSPTWLSATRIERSFVAGRAGGALSITPRLRDIKGSDFFGILPYGAINCFRTNRLSAKVRVSQFTGCLGSIRQELCCAP